VPTPHETGRREAGEESIGGQAGASEPEGEQVIHVATTLPTDGQLPLALYCAICHDSIPVGDPTGIVHAERGDWRAPGPQRPIHAHCITRAWAERGTKWAIVIDRWGHAHV